MPVPSRRAANTRNASDINPSSNVLPHSTKAWNRLRPAPRDDLTIYGFPSKGESRLNDHRAQEQFFNVIFERYMRFCNTSRASLGEQFAKLSFQEQNERQKPLSTSSSLSSSLSSASASASSASSYSSSSSSFVSSAPSVKMTEPDPELTLILTAMRKLREALTSSSRVDDFARTTSLFIVRAAILTGSWPLYVPALNALVTRLAANLSYTCETSVIKVSPIMSYPTGASAAVTAAALSPPQLLQSQPASFSSPAAPSPAPSPAATPSSSSSLSSSSTTTRPSIAPGTALTPSDARAVAIYRTLDAFCRQNDLSMGLRLRAVYKLRGELSVDAAVDALIHGSWLKWWDARRKVDGYCRALMAMAEYRVRRQALKTVGKAYLRVELKWLEDCVCGDADIRWEDIATEQKLGWEIEGNEVIIKKIKK